MKIRIAVGCFVLLLLTASSVAQSRTVALTFDDLPLADAGLSANRSPAERLAETHKVNRAILGTLRKHHAWAIAFVNEEKVVRGGAAEANRAVLREWVRAGNELGNHTYSHPDLSRIAAEDFEKNVIDGEASIAPLMAEAGKQVRYLRFPFNHTGETTDKHAAVAAFLRHRGYEVATCTIDNSDFVFARAYRLMLDRHDAKSANRLRAAYLDYSHKEIQYYTRLHKQIFGREIPHVMLLHASRLNADTLDQILKIFEKMNYRFVTLQQAQADPAYQAPDTYVSEYGPMWGYRWAKEMNTKVDGSQELEVPKWVEQYGN
jgi:peptidoglycan/xylan/chitin deacetylase (PgdA/CDA1 family)